MDTTTPPDTARQPRQRFLAPDLTRGVMLAIIALANVLIYLHDRPYGLRQHVLTGNAFDEVVSAGIGLFVDARGYPLFAALFGYGIVQMIRSRRDRGVAEEEIRRTVRRRSVGLILFGAVHALLAFSGDILGWYGLIGLVLGRVLRLPDRTLLRLAAIWLVVAAIVQGALFADPTPSMQRSYFWSYAIADPLEATGWRLVEWVMAPFGLLAVVSAMLVGVWAGRHRILEHPERHRVLLVRTAVVGITVGVLGGIGSMLVGAGLWSPPFAVAAALAWLHVVSGVFCGLGYAALLALVAARLTASGRDQHWGVRALQAAGQKSLSCYLAQSIVFATLLAASTVGWGARLGPAAAAALALLTWAGTVAAAAATAGRPGPAEALLQRFVRGRRPAVRATISG